MTNLDDLISQIENLTPDKPEFGNFVLSQILNANKSDPRGRRWDVKMISLSMNIWAR